MAPPTGVPVWRARQAALIFGVMSDPISRLSQALEGRYTIERELGEGGMATVFLARDLKHNRHVALKLLKPELAVVVGAERFLAEIETTANLQHPHILPLYDSGEADGFLFYVMPHVEGETLRDRLDREKQLPLEDAVRIASSVAAALDYAHRQGVVHRDIKPANILFQDGQPVVGDFGIALAVGAAGGTRLTETGMSVGTPHYMSPEQATGDVSVGPPSDIYALACVLYEMLIGEPPFTGATAQAILGKIIQGELTSAASLRSSIPGNVDAALGKALEKLPADRFTRAQDFAAALADPGFRTADGAARTAGANTGPWKVAALAAASLAVLLGGAFAWALSSPDAGTVGRFSINLPDSVPMAYIGSASLGNGRQAFAITRDGTKLVYVGQREGVNRLYIRPLDAYEIEVLPGTEGAYNPFFSPDGAWVGFFVGNEVQKVSLDGQDPVPLASIINPMGADWGLDDEIVVGTESMVLYEVPAEGGSIRVLRDGAASGDGFLYPRFLPGGEGVLSSAGGGIRVSDLGNQDNRWLREDASNGRYVASGHVVWNQYSTLFAAPFDLGAREIVGQGVPVLSGVRTEIFGVSQWDISETGVLLYAPGSAVSTRALTWVKGKEREPLPFEGTPHGTFQLSPDGTRVAIEVEGAGKGIWIYDFRTGSRERLGVGEDDDSPVWSRDGTRLAFSRFENGSLIPYVTRVDAGAEPRRLSPDLLGHVSSWSEDGSLVALQSAPGVAVFDLDRSTLIDVAPEPAWGGVLSPDAKAIAYTTGASGEYQIFVEPFPPTGLRRLVSPEGGSEEPIWSRDGSRLYYRNNQRIMVSRITREPELSPGTPTIAFEGDFVNVGGRSYDVAVDGSFLIIDGGDGLTTTLHVVPNWLDELKQRVPR